VAIVSLRPKQATCDTRSVRHGIDSFSAVKREPDMRIVIWLPDVAGPLRHYHDHESHVIASVRHPDDAGPFGRSFMDDAQSTKRLIKLDTGVQVGNVQGNVCD
jgi:hypothetical protein